MTLFIDTFFTVYGPISVTSWANIFKLHNDDPGLESSSPADPWRIFIVSASLWIQDAKNMFTFCFVYSRNMHVHFTKPIRFVVCVF